MKYSEAKNKPNTLVYSSAPITIEKTENELMAGFLEFLFMAGYWVFICMRALCFYCGAEMLKEVKLRYLKWPRCGANLT